MTTSVGERPARVSDGRPLGNFLRGVRSSEGYALGVGIHSALSARLAERAGFDAVWLSSLEISSSKALPDANLITATEVASILREARHATALPIIVDADNGYGSDDTAIRAIEDFAAAGATAVCVEDNAFPKRCSFYEGGGRDLEDPEAFARRIAAVRRAADGRLEVVARTEGLVAGEGADATVERARRYVDAGADAIFVQTKRATVDEYLEVLPRVRDFAPIMSFPTVLPSARARELHELGADLIVYSNVVIRATVKALSTSLAALRSAECIEAITDSIASLDALFDVTEAYGSVADRPAPAQAVM